MSRYDFWLTTTPEDEADAAAERRARQEAAERAYEAAQDPPEPFGAMADYAYSVGPSDLAERNRSEVARLARLFGNDWAEGLPA